MESPVVRMTARPRPPLPHELDVGPLTTLVGPATIRRMATGLFERAGGLPPGRRAELIRYKYPVYLPGWPRNIAVRPRRLSNWSYRVSLHSLCR